MKSHRLTVIPDFQCYFSERLSDGRCLSRFKVFCIAWFVCKVCVGVYTSCIICAQNSCEMLFVCVCVCSRSCILHSHNSYEMLCVCVCTCVRAVFFIHVIHIKCFVRVYIYIICICAPAFFVHVVHVLCFVHVLVSMLLHPSYV